MSFANVLKDLMKEHHVTQSQLASAIGFSQRAVSKWINAQAEPTETAIVSSANYFGVTMDEMLGQSEFPHTLLKSGQKSLLSVEEKVLLTNFRSSSEFGKARIMAYADLIKSQEDN
ncbi:MAG: helix-turn-helix transcriptional regulator [Clostridia bacterium]|nr:helix-turn-helix transcriptional regulator [Clostridia bacterium]